MKYDIEMETLPEALGLTPDREKEIDAAIENGLEEIQARERYSPAMVLEMGSKIPQTIEETYYVGSMLGGVVQQMNERRNNPIAKIMRILAED